MEICLDIQPALAQRAGVGRYVRMLAEHLIPFAGNDELRFFYFDFKRRGCDFAPPGIDQRAVRWLPGRVVQKAWKTVGFPPFDWFSGKADVFHFPNFIRPPLTRGKSVVTIHDASFIRHPETLEEKNYRHLMQGIRQTVEKADAIICISQFTADELKELLHVPAEKLHAIHCGLTSAHQRAKTDDVTGMRNALKLDRPYLLSVGTIEPRKNYRFLVEVFEHLSFDGDLVIAGMRGWKNDGLYERCAASPRRDRIRFLEYVDEQHLAALYSGAEIFVTTSLYEGFGFTPLEAMQCGTPVLAAATGSMPEVLGDAARFVRGFDIEEWTAAANALLSDKSGRDVLVERGRARVNLYSWEKAAKETWDVYRSLA